MSPLPRSAIFHGSAAPGAQTMRIGRTVRLYAPAAIYALGVWLVGGLNSTPVAPTGMDGLDKLAHFGMYGGLGFLLGRGWAATGRGATWVLPALFALSLGAADELRQATLPGRSAELADWVADAAGVAIGFAAAVGLARRKRQIGANERE